MRSDRLVRGLTGVFAATTALVFLVSVAFAEPVLLVVAVPLGLATYAFWYQSSGALRERLGRTRRRPWPGGRHADGRREARRRGDADSRHRHRSRQGSDSHRRREQRRSADAPPRRDTGMTPAEAYRELGLERSADERDVRRAYRERVKDAHPDRGGDEEAFRRVTRAYETLQE